MADEGERRVGYPPGLHIRLHALGHESPHIWRGGLGAHNDRFQAMPTGRNTCAGDDFPQDGSYAGGRYAVEECGIDGVGGRGGGEGIAQVAGREVED